jgi:arylsulfatase A-like enzyme
MENGYYVAGIGRIYHGQGDLQYWHHFEYGPYSPCPENPEYPFALGNPLDVPDSLTGDWKRAKNAIKIIDQDIDSPLFLACGIIRPHTPWDVPRRFFDMYPLDSIELPPVLEDDLEDVPSIAKRIAGREHSNRYCGQDNSWSHQEIVDSDLWKINIRAYLASITYADEQIGRIIEAWNNSKYAENGIIVLWGDHGWHHGEKMHWSKRTLWEEGTRTPMIISAPGLTAPGTVCSTPVSLLDIFPTLVDVCGLSARNDLDGLSIAPLLLDPDVPWDRPAITIWGQDNVSVRSSKWRYTHYCDGTKELYDHEKDPNEWVNLAGSPEYIQQINRLHRWVPACVEPAPSKRESWFVRNGLVCD